MFFNPAKTGLIILGASDFQHDSGLNRTVFKNAHDEIINYFRSPNKGLGLHNKNIFDGFDLRSPKGELILDIDRFLSERELADVFVYICSHGYVDGRYLRFFLANTIVNDEDTTVNFEKFIDRIEQASGCRVYCIVDCCSSGVIHRNSPEIVISPEAAAYVSNAETLALPKRGSVILTANNSTNVGTVYAHDDLPGVELPVFSHCLLQLLNEGSAERAGYGLSFEQIQTDLASGIPIFLEELNKEDGVEINDIHGTHVPQFSDRPLLDAEKNGNIISRIGVFPNNDARHDLVSRVSRSIRINYDRVSRQWDRITELENEIDPIKQKNEELQKELTGAMNARRNLWLVIWALFFLLAGAFLLFWRDINPVLDFLP